MRSFIILNARRDPLYSYWFADEELFFETHGNLSSKDVVDIEKYVNTLNNKNILSSNWKKA